MIPWNYNIYGIATADYLYYNDSNPIGTLLNETTYGYFYDNNPLYSINRDVKLDESIYLWHIGAGSSAGTNAAFCLSTGDTLELQVAYNQPVKVPLAMQLCNTDTRDFYKDPKARLCYDFLEYTWVNYYKSKLFVDINRTKFCINPRIRCYNTSNNAKTTRTLTDIVSYINGDPEHRFPYLMYLDLYNGDTTPRGTEMSYVPSESVLGNATPDILIDRPIPDNATAVKLDLQYLPLAMDNPQENWIDDKQYSPFTQAIPQAWYDGVLSLVMPYCIGELLQNTVQQIRTGRKTATYNANKITGGFMHVSTKVQEFDDVVYQWKMHNIYEEGFIEIENGFPLDTLPNNHHISTVSLLHIIDKKDAATMGEAVQRALKHEIAFFGFYFADNETDAKTATLGTANDHVYLPEFIDGTTTGRYFTGDEIPDVPYANATTCADDAFIYNPSDMADSGDWSYSINSGTIGAGVKYYALTETNMNNLCKWLNTTYNPTDETQFIQDFKGQNPGDYLVSVMYYPFDIPVESGTDETIVVGKLTASGSTGRVLKYKYGDLYDFGSYTIPENGNYLDYMRKISVIVPFCGTKDLDPLIWTGQTLTVKMAIDFPTGACTAYLFRGSHPMDTLSGSLGVPLPLSALSNGSYQVAITNMLAQKNQATIGGITRAGTGIASIAGGALDLKSSGAMSAGSIASIAGGAISAAGGVAQTVVGLPNLEYNIEHTQPEIKQIDGGSPFINCGSDFRVKIIICTPVLSDSYNPASYGKTTGFATCKQGILSTVSSGYTECAGADLSGINATSTEKAMIFNALKSGVFV